MRPHRSLVAAVSVGWFFAAACGGATPSESFPPGSDGGPPPGKDGGSGSRDAGVRDGSGPTPHPNPDAAGGDANGTALCAPNPANYDIPGNNCDDDDDGIVDNPPACDNGLALAGTAYDFGSALDLCTGTASARTDGGDGRWGIISAIYTRSFTDNTQPPADGQWGIMSGYGTAASPATGPAVNPQVGKALGVLSSGYARDFDDATLTSCDLSSAGTGTNAGCFKYGQSMDTAICGLKILTGCSTAPPGFPQNTTGCPSTAGEAVHDLIDVKLQIRVPANAQGFSFDFNFLSGEWPEYVCSPYNDSFIAYLTSSAFNAGDAGNISFDSNSNPINVNSGFFNECTPKATLGCDGTQQKALSVCSAGTSGLDGTGFAATGTFCGTDVTTAGGATGWLTSQAPVTPGEVITIEFMIWDTKDANFDSSVILDAFTWQPTPTEIITHPTPNPQ